MKYENILLELMSRINTLESEVSKIKETLNEQQTTKMEITSQQEIKQSKNYTKMTPEMIQSCYDFGKKAYRNPEINIKDYADKVTVETGMNENSAIMYIAAVKNLLEGNIYKRAINSTALRKYLEMIEEEFGKNGLTKALAATEKHIEYLNACKITTKALSKIYAEFIKKIG